MRSAVLEPLKWLLGFKGLKITRATASDDEAKHLHTIVIGQLCFFHFDLSAKQAVTVVS